MPHSIPPPALVIPATQPAPCYFAILSEPAEFSRQLLCDPAVHALPSANATRSSSTLVTP